MSPSTLCFSLLLLLLLSTSNASQTKTPVYQPPVYKPPVYKPPVSYKPPVVTPYLPPAQPTSDIYLYLAGHNNARAAVGLAPLAWDTKLAAYAQNWANQRRGDCALIHSSGPYGENIFWGSGSSWSPADAVSSWVVERRWYDYYSNSCGYGEDCGHYTQIVWRNSKRVGCAKAICYSGLGVFITCNYDPPGNYIGSRPY